MIARAMWLAMLVLPASALLADEGGRPSTLAGHYELAPQLRGGLSATDDAVRARCAFLLGRIGDRASAPSLRPLLNDPSIAVRHQTGIALCALADEEGVATAEAALTSAAEWIRYYAVQALAAVATDRARLALEGQRPAQGEFIGTQIDEALGAWPSPSAPPAPAAEKLGPYGNLHDLFYDAADPLVVESDRYWHVGQYPQCVRCNEAAIFLDPHYVDLYGTSAWLLWSMGLNDRATSLLRQGLAANPKDWNMWFDAGYQYYLMNDLKTAVRLLGRAVELGAPSPQNHQYCHALEKSGRPDLALKAWEDLHRKFPDDPLPPRHIERLKKVLAGETGSAAET
jgi:tetratricopeptide (TPR) repeat protein